MSLLFLISKFSFLISNPGLTWRIRRYIMILLENDSEGHFPERVVLTRRGSQVLKLDLAARIVPAAPGEGEGGA